MVKKDEDWQMMMTEMERDIYTRAAKHYIRKHDILVEYECGRPPITIKEFWDDYFAGKELLE